MVALELHCPEKGSQSRARQVFATIASIIPPIVGGM